MDTRDVTPAAPRGPTHLTSLTTTPCETADPSPPKAADPSAGFRSAILPNRRSVAAVPLRAGRTESPAGPCQSVQTTSSPLPERKRRASWKLGTVPCIQGGTRDVAGFRPYAQATPRLATTARPGSSPGQRVLPINPSPSVCSAGGCDRRRAAYGFARRTCSGGAGRDANVPPSSHGDCLQAHPARCSAASRPRPWTARFVPTDFQRSRSSSRTDVREVVPGAEKR